MAKIPSAAKLAVGQMFPSNIVEDIRRTGEVAEFIESEVLVSIKFMGQQNVVMLTGWRSDFA